ncbi:hypothetical protein [Streptomyces sp. NPDC006132]|uniref:hypothetical protein n=1 Tax=Streptomyces sp. NPDC006132 TaxID=3156732 RepID=UPI0033CCE68A
MNGVQIRRRFRITVGGLDLDLLGVGRDAVGRHDVRAGHVHLSFDEADLAQGVPAFVFGHDAGLTCAGTPAIGTRATGHRPQTTGHGIGWIPWLSVVQAHTAGSA